MSAPPRVGIVGAGQLARMMALAATGLDIRVTVLSPSADDPAARGPAEHILGSPESLDDLRRLAAACDVVTFDHERVPPEHLRALVDEGFDVQPPPEAKIFAQDKALQREALGERLGIAIPEHRLVRTPDEVDDFAAATGWPVVLKVRSGGYDGRGVWIAGDPAAAREGLREAQAGGPEVLVERFVPIQRELAGLVARSTKGESVAYPVVETVQRDGMCREASAPAAVPAEVAGAATGLALRIAEGIGATGILAVELFLADEGLIVNELALRPHNSGHLTLGGCVTSQFENHVRAVLGLPLGSAELVAPASTMVNVVGAADGSDPRSRLADALTVPGALVQLYGKEARRGRKLGHVTALGPSAGDSRGRAWQAARALEGKGAPDGARGDGARGDGAPVESVPGESG